MSCFLTVIETFQELSRNREPYKKLRGEDMDKNWKRKSRENIENCIGREKTEKRPRNYRENIGNWSRKD